MAPEFGDTLMQKDNVNGVLAMPAAIGTGVLKPDCAALQLTLFAPVWVLHGVKSTKQSVAA